LSIVSVNFWGDSDVRGPHAEESVQQLKKQKLPEG
jgi:hypothetical protein